MVQSLFEFVRTLITHKTYSHREMYDKGKKSQALQAGENAEKLEPKTQEEKQQIEDKLDKNLWNVSEPTIEKMQMQNPPETNATSKKQVGDSNQVKAQQSPSVRDDTEDTKKERDPKKDNSTGMEKTKDSDKPAGNSGIHKIIEMTKSKVLEPMKTDYAQKLAKLSPQEIYDNYNPGPTKPDGTVNFECHCVAHLVGSPCGNEFRKAITCQKSASEDEMEKGACADEFVQFMECAIKTQCFRLRDDENKEGADSSSKN